jgi:hypothetical protein
VLAVVGHRSGEFGRGVTHSYLFTAIANHELCGIVGLVPTIPFTERALHSLRPLPRSVEYYDRKTSGLSLRVLPTGKKTFYLVYRPSSPALPPTSGASSA